jgi:glutaredoxin
MKTQVLGLSVDSADCLRAWAESLGGITYPLLSDFWPHGRVAQLFGVLRTDGRSERAIFVMDKNGVIRYVDVHDIDEQPNNDLLFRVLGEIEPQAAARASVTQPAANDPLPTGDLILYCTPWCPDCKRARAYLAEKGISYVEVDISKNRAAAQRVRGWADGNETTPTFDIKGTIVVEFERQRLEKLLQTR